MTFLKFTSKNKNGCRNVRFSYAGGIPGLCKIPGEVIDVTIDRRQGVLFFRSALFRRQTASLDLSRIEKVRILSGGDLRRFANDISPSVFRQKKKIDSQKFVVISYLSLQGMHQHIFLEVVGASIGWKKFVQELSGNQPESCKLSAPGEHIFL